MDNKKVYAGSGIGLGVLVWIVFMILGYGFGSQANSAGFCRFLFENQFWIWFPLWIGTAIVLGLATIILLVCLVVKIIDYVNNKKYEKELAIKKEKKRAEIKAEHEAREAEEEAARKAKEAGEQYIRDNYDYDLRLHVGVSMRDHNSNIIDWLKQICGNRTVYINQDGLFTLSMYIHNAVKKNKIKYDNTLSDNEFKVDGRIYKIYLGD